MQGATVQRSVPSMRTETPETASPPGPATVTTSEPLRERNPTPSTRAPNVTAASAMAQRLRAGLPGGGNTDPVTGATDWLGPRFAKSAGIGAGFGIGGSTFRMPGDVLVFHGF